MLENRGRNPVSSDGADLLPDRPATGHVPHCSAQTRATPSLDCVSELRQDTRPVSSNHIYLFGLDLIPLGMETVLNPSAAARTIIASRFAASPRGSNGAYPVVSGSRSYNPEHVLLRTIQAVVDAGYGPGTGGSALRFTFDLNRE